jgi:hypothetical protein
VTTLLRQSGRGEDVLRADQPITRGRLDAGWDRRGKEIKATLKARQARQDWHQRRIEPPQLGRRHACVSPYPTSSRRPPRFHRVKVRQRSGRATNEVRTGAATGRVASRSEMPDPIANVQPGDDPTTWISPGTLPHRRCDSDRPAKARRKAGVEPMSRTRGRSTNANTPRRNRRRVQTSDGGGLREPRRQSIALNISPASGWSHAKA